MGSEQTILPTFEYDQCLAGGFRLPARMTALPLPEGKLALVSPIPLTDSMVAELAALGEVTHILAPNLFHHLYVGAALKRYPQAQLLAPAALRKKCPELPLARVLEEGLPEALTATLTLVHIAGAPKLDEFVVYHKPSRTLVVADLVFNMTQPQGWVAGLLLRLVGAHGKLAQSRVVRFLLKDKQAARASTEQLLALPFENLVVAHGEVIQGQAKQRLMAVLQGV